MRQKIVLLRLFIVLFNHFFQIGDFFIKLFCLIIHTVFKCEIFVLWDNTTFPVGIKLKHHFLRFVTLVYQLFHWFFCKAFTVFSCFFVYSFKQSVKLNRRINHRLYSSKHGIFELVNSDWMRRARTIVHLVRCHATVIFICPIGMIIRLFAHCPVAIGTFYKPCKQVNLRLQGL